MSSTSSMCCRYLQEGGTRFRCQVCLMGSTSSMCCRYLQEGGTRFQVSGVQVHQECLWAPNSLQMPAGRGKCGGRSLMSVAVLGSMLRMHMLLQGLLQAQVFSRCLQGVEEVAVHKRSCRSLEMGTTSPHAAGGSYLRRHSGLGQQCPGGSHMLCVHVQAAPQSGSQAGLT